MKTALLCFLMLCGNHAAMANPNDDITDAETINVPQQLDEPQTDQVKPMVPRVYPDLRRDGMFDDHAWFEAAALVHKAADDPQPSDQLKPVSIADFDPFNMTVTEKDVAFWEHLRNNPVKPPVFDDLVEQPKTKSLGEMLAWFEQHALKSPAELAELARQSPAALAELVLTSRERTKRELDPGITDVVQLLWDNGFETCDSGDGESKPLGPDVIPFPHVFMQVSLESFFPELLRLGEVLQREGVVCDDSRRDPVPEAPLPGHAAVEGTFGVQWAGGRAPALHDGLIAVFGLNNEGLRLARERAGIEVTKSS